MNYCSMDTETNGADRNDVWDGSRERAKSASVKLRAG